MTNKEIACALINQMPEEKVKAFVTLFSDENQLARIEADFLLNNKDAKRYDDISELMNDIGIK